MTQGIETLAVKQWLYGVLSADTTIKSYVSTRIYDTVAPQGATYPFVIIATMAPGNDLQVVGAARIWTEGVWLVKGVAQAATFGGNLQSLAARMDALLHKAQGTVSNGTVYACVRQQPFEQVEVVEGGVQYRHLGGVYRVMAG